MSVQFNHVFSLNFVSLIIELFRGHPLTGCCGVAARAGRCVVDQCVDGDLFAAVSHQNFSVAKRIRVGLVRSCKYTDMV